MLKPSSFSFSAYSPINSKKKNSSATSITSTSTKLFISSSSASRKAHSPESDTWSNKINIKYSEKKALEPSNSVWALVSFSFCLCSSIRKNYTRSSCMFIKRNNKSLSMKPKQNPSSSIIISPFLHSHSSSIPTKSASPPCSKPSTATNLSSVTPF